MIVLLFMYLPLPLIIILQTAFLSFLKELFTIKPSYGSIHLVFTCSLDYTVSLYLTLFLAVLLGMTITCTSMRHLSLNGRTSETCVFGLLVDFTIKMPTSLTGGLEFSSALDYISLFLCT